jgi:hypothetical protein
MLWGADNELACPVEGKPRGGDGLLRGLPLGAYIIRSGRGRQVACLADRQALIAAIACP